MTEDSLKKSMEGNYPSGAVTRQGQYYIVREGQLLQDVFWVQDGLVFHAVTPSDIDMEEMEEFCKAEKVEIK